MLDLPPVRIKLGTARVLVGCSLFWTDLAWATQVNLKRSFAHVSLDFWMIYLESIQHDLRTLESQICKQYQGNWESRAPEYDLSSILIIGIFFREWCIHCQLGLVHEKLERFHKHFKMFYKM